MATVIDYANTGNPVTNNWGSELKTLKLQPTGVSLPASGIKPGLLTEPSVTGINAQYSGKFDDYTYYT